MFKFSQFSSYFLGSTVFLAMAFCGIAQAQRVSGGGNVLACDQLVDVDPAKHNGYRQVTMEKYTLLDFYDAERPGGYGFKIDMGPGPTAMEKVKFVLNRLAKIDKFRADIYLKLSEKFLSEATFDSDGSTATDSNDLGSGYFLKDRCRIQRAVILNSPDEQMLSGNQIKYRIMQKMWDQFDETTKAGMMLHEIAYSEATFRGYSNSLAVRRYVGLISSDQVLKVDYQLEIIKAGLGRWGELDTSRIDADENILFELPTTKTASINESGMYISRSENDYLKFKVETQELKCKGVKVSLDRLMTNNKMTLINFYSQLFSGRNMKLSEIPNGIVLEYRGCKDMRVHFSSSMLPNSEIDFDFIAEQKQTWWDGLISNKRITAYINSGSVDGRDVSGKKCDIYFRTSQEGSYVRKSNFYCQDHKGKSY